MRQGIWSCSTAGRRRVASCVLAVTSLVFITGCGSPPEGAGDENAGRELSLVDRLPDAKGDIEHLNWALPQGEPNTLDPARAQDYGEITVISNLCDTLLRLNPDFSVSPNLADFVQKDPKTIIYTLKPGITFWDGSEMTSADVVYSLERALVPAESTMESLIRSIDSVEATGKYEVTVRLSVADPLAHKELAAVPGTIYQAAYAEKAGKGLGTADGGIMCSGPFKLSAWKPGSGIEMVRNNEYWNPEWRARASSATFKFLPDSVALAQALAAGEVQGVYEVPPTIIPRLSEAPIGELHYGPSFGYVQLLVMSPDGPLAELDIRKALFGSIDRDAIASSIYRGTAEANYTYAAKNNWDPQATEVWEAAYPEWVEENRLDVETAKALVKEAGGIDRPIVLTVPQGDQSLSQIAQVVQANASEIGLQVDIRPGSTAQLAQQRESAEARKGIDLMLFTSAGVVGDTQETVPYYISSDSTTNYTNYTNPRVDELFKQALDTPDPTARAELLVEAQRLYEPVRVAATLLATPTILFLDKSLAGATVSYAYLYEPSLARIGAAG